MPKSRAHLRSSRRIPSLVDSDIDHEIDIVDRAARVGGSKRLSASTANNSAALSYSEEPLIPPASQTPLTPSATREETARSSDNTLAGARPATEQHVSVPPIDESKPTGITQGNKVAKTASNSKRRSQRQRRSSREPETAIDVLYENQRGCFCCGLPLFSSAALGNLDPPAWTNFAHKPSPTNVRTAQVPDPSWVWVWPEWRVNRDDFIDTDKDGWEYSFAFSKKFSWHAPKWWNSFVRRRAWIRRRVKKVDLDEVADPYVINAGYFDVSPAREHRHSRSRSRTSSVPERMSIGKSPSRRSRERGRTSEEVLSRTSRDVSRDLVGGDADFILAKEEVQLRTIEDLMVVLRRSRIDREKLEAVENYISHCSDELAPLQDYMHDVMALFIFQVSRKLLLARLTHLYDELTAAATTATADGSDGKGKGKKENDEGEVEEKEKSPERHRRLVENLAAAITHADEEVRKLEYWSDIKAMAESGESGGAVDPDRGWGCAWEGIDKSGAKGPLKDTLP
ncbi:hypothetical protein DL764_004532 [Monosporascus ibericus]|uniref:Peroxin/Ferlin domain-containing protein n=1 Tax=Monosporascus ibericus TaxID=155417 RepID=A0A4V1XAY2_9PEZI|nr:hypothetical protein DL764_004532 [Monosporascus ibericus]